ncbi:acyl-CoA N-acyltransferase [Trametes polyzona]|nr:acyl-CoA N-acyltransferase [Trametes polyzona]
MPPAGITFELAGNPTEALVEEAAQLFADLMAESPSAIALAGGDASLVPLLGREMIRGLVFAPGTSHMFVAKDENGALVGYALFSLPAKLVPTALGSERQDLSMSEFTRRLSPEGQKYFSDVMSKEIPKANFEAFGVEGAERDMYWCHFAMVQAEYQGKGIMRALFDLATAEAGKTGTTMALSTTKSRNIAIYEKLGFTLCGYKDMSSPWIDWSTWILKKEMASPDSPNVAV